MDDLLLAQKVEAMIQYAYVALRQFPKSERHVLSQELRLTLWRILRLVIVSAKRRDPRQSLAALDADIELLRRQIRLARELGMLPISAVTARIRSWIGHAQHADSWRVREQLLAPVLFGATS